MTVIRNIVNNNYTCQSFSVGKLARDASFTIIKGLEQKVGTCDSQNKRAGYPGIGVSRPFANYIKASLRLADFEYFRATAWANALGRRSAVLHRDGFDVFHLLFGAAFHAITLHIWLLLS